MLYQHWYDNSKSYCFLGALFDDHESLIVKLVLEHYDKFTPLDKKPRILSKNIESDPVSNFFEKLLQLNKKKTIHLLAQLTAIVREEITVSKILEAGGPNPKVQGFALLLQKYDQSVG
ncbi:uncharacterized protein PHALS_07970 [Plasmopara halstedii]|uniref:Uncharacterized protein n=1 Tax=Plasmopara halstedii TaxID=4781 RepID=A0A0P1B7D9_PLAHL|nr:uncharacterized protein PHALS_07970 [Plasmopara halstedii]CEG50246.1 hypothetical protein PHALS_07970 [Plasmopara halstedii]|eukprot:XP_024586615.1 hypothetical protein PHALS_07970 [Plasmopara halstedii]